MTTSRINQRTVIIALSYAQRQHPHYALVLTARHAVSKGFDDARGPRARAQEVSAIAAMTASVQERAFVIIFGLPLFCTRERGTDLRVVVFERIDLYMGKHVRFI